jgi:hypothetical protein
VPSRREKRFVDLIELPFPAVEVFNGLNRLRGRNNLIAPGGKSAAILVGEEQADTMPREGESIPETSALRCISPMSYSEEQIHELYEGAERVCADLTDLVERMTLGKWRTLSQPKAREFLHQGVCRRFNVIRHAIERVFAIFPPERTQILEREELLDVQTYLHALVINVYGVLDNLAWVFVIERGLEATFGDKRRIGLVLPATQHHLPAPFRQLLQSKEFSDWYSIYAKNYRDALAHRVPLYVPPYSVKDETQWSKLEQEKFKHLAASDLEQFEALEKQQDALQQICAVFLHSTSDPEGSRPLVLHPQIVSDAMTVANLANEFGKTFDSPA